MVGVAGTTQADARKTCAQLLQFVGSHDFRIVNVGAAGHFEAIVSFSLFVRLKKYREIGRMED
jgi:hypothetical protein